MEELTRVFYNAPHEIYLEKNIAIYFYITGVSAAFFILSTLAYVFGMERFKAIGRFSAVLAPIAVAIGPIFLVIDLLQPTRFHHLFYMFNLASPITWGTIFLTIYPPICLIYIYSIYKDKASWAKLFGAIGIPFSIGVHVYAGFLMALSKGVAFWNTPLMPIYFLASAMVSGTALLILSAIIKEKVFGNNRLINKLFPKIENNVIYEISKFLAIFIIIDLFVALSDTLLLFYTTPENLIAGQLLLEGEFSSIFLYVQVLLGMVIPFIVLLIPKLNRSFSVLTIVSILVLVGVWAMRYLTVIAGQYVPLM